MSARTLGWIVGVALLCGAESIAGLALIIWLATTETDTKAPG